MSLSATSRRQRPSVLAAAPSQLRGSEPPTDGSITTPWKDTVNHALDDEDENVGAGTIIPPVDPYAGATSLSKLIQKYLPPPAAERAAPSTYTTNLQTLIKSTQSNDAATTQPASILSRTGRIKQSMADETVDYAQTSTGGLRGTAAYDSLPYSNTALPHHSKWNRSMQTPSSIKEQQNTIYLTVHQTDTLHAHRFVRHPAVRVHSVYDQSAPENGPATEAIQPAYSTASPPNAAPPAADSSAPADSSNSPSPIKAKQGSYVTSPHDPAQRCIYQSQLGTVNPGDYSVYWLTDKDSNEQGDTLCLQYVTSEIVQQQQSVLLLLELLDFTPQDGYIHLAYAFLQLNTEVLELYAADERRGTCGNALRLQMYSYNSELPPTQPIYQHYLSQLHEHSQHEYPSTLHVSLQTKPCDVTLDQRDVPRVDYQTIVELHRQEREMQQQLDGTTNFDTSNGSLQQLIQCQLPNLQLYTISHTAPQCVSATAFSPDGQHLAVAYAMPEQNNNSSTKCYTVRICRAQTGDVATVFTGSQSRHYNYIYHLQWSHDSASLLSCSADETCKVWYLPQLRGLRMTKAIVYTLQQPTYMYACAFVPGPQSSNRPLIASAGFDATVRFFEVKDRKSHTEVTNKTIYLPQPTTTDAQAATFNRMFINCMAFSTDGSTLFVGTNTGSIYVYALSVRSHNEAAESVCIDSGGDSAITCIRYVQPSSSSAACLYAYSKEHQILQYEVDAPAEQSAVPPILTLTGRYSLLDAQLPTVDPLMQRTLVKFDISSDNRYIVTPNPQQLGHILVLEAATGKIVKHMHIFGASPVSAVVYQPNSNMIACSTTQSNDLDNGRSVSVWTYRKAAMNADSK